VQTFKFDSVGKVRTGGGRGGPLPGGSPPLRLPMDTSCPLAQARRPAAASNAKETLTMATLAIACEEDYAALNCCLYIVRLWSQVCIVS
jgi:hypothetical protein